MSTKYLQLQCFNNILGKGGKYGSQWARGGTCLPSADCLKKQECAAEMEERENEEMEIEGILKWASGHTENSADSEAIADKLDHSGATADKLNQSGATADKLDQSGATADKPDQSEATADKLDKSGATADKPDQPGATAGQFEQSGGVAGVLSLSEYVTSIPSKTSAGFSQSGASNGEVRQSDVAGIKDELMSFSHGDADNWDDASWVRIDSAVSFILILLLNFILSHIITFF